MVTRWICHADADAFYATVHIREDPSLAGKPLVVAGSSPRSIVTTASYEARRYGIHSAMPASRARSLCPEAVFVAPDRELYRSYSQRAVAVMNAYSDLVEPASPDEAYIDLTHHENPENAARRMQAELLEQTGVMYSIGLGNNRLCAKVLSDYRKPAAFNVASIPQCQEIFADASPGIIPGIGPKTTRRLAEISIDTLAKLRAQPLERLSWIFGARHGVDLYERARFRSQAPVRVDRQIKSQSEEHTFQIDVDDYGELEATMRRLCVELCQRLSDRDLSGRTVGIKVRLDDFKTVTRARTLPGRTNDVELVYSTALELLHEYDPERPVRLIGVRVAGFEDPAARQPPAGQDSASAAAASGDQGPQLLLDI